MVQKGLQVPKIFSVNLQCIVATNSSLANSTTGFDCSVLLAMKVISVHLFQADLQTKMSVKTPEQTEATSQPEETKAQSVLLSALELAECPAKETTKEVEEYPKTRQLKKIPNVKSVVIAQDQKMSSSPTMTSLPVVSKTEEYKRKGIIEADRGSHNQRTRNHTYRGGYVMAPYVQANNSRPQNHGVEWVHPLNPQLLSSARQGYQVNTNNSPAVAPCLPPAPWLSMVPCLPPAPFLPVAPCLPQTTWLPMASPPPATWLPVAPPPPATWLPMGPPPPPMWLPVTSSSPSTTWLPMAPASSGPMAPCVPPPAPWCPTAPWLSPPPYLPPAPWLPVAPALPSCLPSPPDHFSFALQPVASHPQPHFSETTLTAPSYSSRVKSLPPPPYSSFFTNTPPPLYSMAPLNPTAAPYSPPPAYSSSSPAANPEAPSTYSSPGNPSVTPASTSSPLNPAAPPYKSPSPVSSLPTPPAEPWIPPSKEPEPDTEPSFFSAAPFSEDPIFSTVWKPLAAELFASSKTKSKTSCVKSDWDPLSEYEGGSVWSSKC